MEYSPATTYLQETEDLLADIEQCALALDEGKPAPELVNQLFRAFHTIKGSGAMCGFDRVAKFTHYVETLLDLVRNEAIPVSPRLVELILAAKDQIRLLLAVEQGAEAADNEACEQLVAELLEFSDASPSHSEPAKGPGTEPSRNTPPQATEEHDWTIRFRPNPAFLCNGGNPVALFRDLSKLGGCGISADIGSVPPLAELRPDQCYLGWNITLRTSSGSNEIRDVFIFVEDESHLEIECVDGAANLPAHAVAPSPGSAPASQLPAAGAVVQTSRQMLPVEATVRVPAARLDRLVNLVGELVMNQSRLAQAAAQIGAPELANPVQEIERLVGELRDDVLGIRMLPIGTIFGRFRRLVHDLSAELNKQADLVTEGAETELDKSILDRLAEPLVHLLRNSLDHGIESAEERARAGKPPRATIRLSAVHTGSDVVVSVEDDGRGINRAAVRAKAIASQIIAADAKLSDSETVNLVLLPGFSTAQKVTSVSGRGVGMDVVKRQVDALRASLTIASREGLGTRVALTLPLTLAIIDGLLVQVGKDLFIIPMAAILENVELLRAQRLRGNGRNLIEVRGDVIPYIDLRAMFRIDSAAPAVEKVVIVRHEEHRVGLVVDSVIGTHQTVIQPLGRFLRTINVVSGATIMGDGRVALVMDIASVVRFAGQQCRSSVAEARAEAHETPSNLTAHDSVKVTY
jgi:two-component system, chemotaxis family, sensor kinase CheA